MGFGTYNNKYGWRTIEDFDKAMETLKNSYEYMKERVEAMQETLTEWNKDKEIQKLKREKEWIYKHCLLSNLSDKELEALAKFREKHFENCCGNGKYKSKGNTWIYTISGTGIGHIIKITCPECGMSEDVTDIDNW